MPEFLKETVDVGPYKIVLDEEGIVLTDYTPEDGQTEAPSEEDAPYVDLTPSNRREANQLSMALRKASRRLEELAKTLPAE